METNTYERIPFQVEGVQVTKDNLAEIALWTGGTIKQGKTQRYVEITVERPVNVRQTQAYVGDWVTISRGRFKIYTDKTFNETFRPTNFEQLVAKVNTNNKRNHPEDRV